MGVLRQPRTTAELSDAGGAYVKRPFDLGERNLKNGDKLTHKELMAIPEANLRALVNTGLLQLFPAAPSDMFISERFLIPTGNGKFEVIEGHKITKKPVTKQHAQKLMAQG
jgi:hypothetical protein